MSIYTEAVTTGNIEGVLINDTIDLKELNLNTYIIQIQNSNNPSCLYTHLAKGSYLTDSKFNVLIEDGVWVAGSGSSSCCSCCNSGSSSDLVYSDNYGNLAVGFAAGTKFTDCATVLIGGAAADVPGFSVVIGRQAQADGSDAVVIGYGAIAYVDLSTSYYRGGVAIGAFAKVFDAGIGIGAGACATDASIAIGPHTWADCASIALGAGSRTHKPGTLAIRLAGNDQVEFTTADLKKLKEYCNTH